MYTRTGVQGSGFGAPAASRPTRDPPALRGELGPPQAPKQDLEAAPERPSRESTEPVGPRFTGAYTLVAPNEKRRNEIQQMAAKELEELERWKKQQREKSINLPPMTLGGSQSEAEVRQRQQLQLIQSKYQKKLKREECVRIKKEAEEAEVQKMRAAQREKSNKLEEKKRLQENLRRETFREHQQYKTAEFLRRSEADLPHRGACPVAGDDPQPSAWEQTRIEEEDVKRHEKTAVCKQERGRDPSLTAIGRNMYISYQHCVCDRYLRTYWPGQETALCSVVTSMGRKRQPTQTDITL
ncbi:epithelial-stromal interaction protein 1 isoform X3 [Bubalus bubalis]|uniref:epithelial-stromal interaction protein 1 isoform X3 n=1 Tax=Bubalus bubalis TaxID=89462 RepID=UPI001E1B77B7|nr:epithelial-stromal interaction protein 1 isoform X3 [Bubalus bubalis]